MRTDCTKKPMASDSGVLACQRWCSTNAADRLTRWPMALAVVGVAVVAVTRLRGMLDVIENGASGDQARDALPNSAAAP